MHGMSRATAGVTGERLPLVCSSMRAAFVPTTEADGTRSAQGRPETGALCHLNGCCFLWSNG